MGKKNGSVKYNKFKEYKGSRYSGMKIGGSHKWYYDRGEWRERKIKPDEWEISYQTVKRRAGKAPENSGAPVGTEYNWLIIAHQRVDKLDANSYMTRMEGAKFKIAHKRAGNGNWNISEKTQRRKVINYLEQLLEELKAADEEKFVPFTVGTEKRIYGLNHLNREELYELAKDRNIPNRSKMKRQELLEAVKEQMNGVVNPKKSEKTRKNFLRDLMEKSRDDLYKMASKRDIRGRSDMKKAELLKAVRRDLKQSETGVMA